MANNYSNRLANNAKNSGRGFLGIIIGILVIVIIIILVVVIAKSTTKSTNMIVGNPVDAFNFPTDKTFELENSDEGLEFTYSFWIYIHNWNYRRGEWKNIFIKGDDKGDALGSENRAPGIWLYPNTNDLHARINTYANPNEGCDIKNIPLQKWVHISMVLNNRTVDMYVDGKLERSCVLMGVPKLNEDKLHVATDGGFMGKISKLQYFKNALTPDKIYEIYVRGPYL